MGAPFDACLLQALRRRLRPHWRRFPGDRRIKVSHVLRVRVPRGASAARCAQSIEERPIEERFDGGRAATAEAEAEAEAYAGSSASMSLAMSLGRCGSRSA